MDSMGGAVSIVIYFIVIFGVFYFVGIRPQKKERKKQEEMLAMLMAAKPEGARPRRTA